MARATITTCAVQAALVIFQQLGRAEIASNQDRVLAQAHGGGRAHLP